MLPRDTLPSSGKAMGVGSQLKDLSMIYCLAKECLGKSRSIAIHPEQMHCCQCIVHSLRSRSCTTNHQERNGDVSYTWGRTGTRHRLFRKSSISQTASQKHQAAHLSKVVFAGQRTTNPAFRTHRTSCKFASLLHLQMVKPGTEWARSCEQR